jgi:hypothetical protein
MSSVESSGATSTKEVSVELAKTTSDDTPNKTRSPNKSIDVEGGFQTVTGRRSSVAMARADTFKTLRSSTVAEYTPAEISEVLFQFFSNELTKERCDNIANDIIDKYHAHPRVLQGILNDENGYEKLRNLTKEFCPKPKNAQSFKKHFDEFRHVIRGLLDSKGFGDAWDIVILIASFITVVVYVIETELDNLGSDKALVSVLLVWVDFVCTLLFFTDFTLQTLAAVPMIGYCMCGTLAYPLYWFGAGKIDLVTVFPFFVTMIIFRAQQPDLTDSDAPGYVFQKCAPENAGWCLDLLNDKGQIGMGIVIVLVLRMLRVVKTLRFTREDRLEIVLKKQCYFSTHVARMTAIGISMFLGYFTFFASLMYLLEVEVEQLFVVIHNNECATPGYTGHPGANCPAECVSSSGCMGTDFTWPQALYMIVVTFTTVGYGDFSPVTVYGQLVSMFVLIFGVALVSAKINQISTVIATVNHYKKKYLTNPDVGHIVITGAITEENLEALLGEHFHPDHKTADKFEVEDVIIMNPTPPAPFIKNMLVHDENYMKLSYYEGDVLDDEHLADVSIKQAKHAHLLVDPHSKNHELDDARIIVRATALKHSNPDISVHAQCHLTVTKRHLEKLLPYGENQHCPDVVVCLDLLKSRAFAQNCLAPGSSTLIANLFASFSDSELELDNISLGDRWLIQYYHGCGQELYSKPTPPCLIKRTFEEAVLSIFRGHIITPNEDEIDQEPSGVILVGVVEHPDNVNSVTRPRRVLMNPGKDYIIRKDSKLLLIADDEDIATSIQFATKSPKGSDESKHLVGCMRLFLSADDHHHNKNIPEMEQVAKKRRSTIGAVTMRSKPPVTTTDSVPSSPERKPLDADNIHLDALLEHTRNINKKLDALSKRKKKRPRMRLHWTRLDNFEEVDTSHRLKFNNHILICGDNPRLPVFVAALRECLPKHLGKSGIVANIPVVVLSNIDAHHDGREVLGFDAEEVPHHLLGDIYHAQGNPGKAMDLMEACVLTAACVVIMPSHSSREIDNRLDAELLTTYLAVESKIFELPKKGRPRVIVESAFPMAMNLLNTYHQFHFNSLQTDNEAAFDEAMAEEKEQQELSSNSNGHYSGIPLYGAGTIMSARAFDAILCQTTYTPEVLDFLSCCLSMTSTDHLSAMAEHPDDHSGILVQLNIEKRFWKKPYEELYRSMLEEYGMIVIGLYRRDRYTGLPFVYTAPIPSDKVINTDKMFCITSFPCDKATAKYLQKESSGKHFKLNNGGKKSPKEKGKGYETKQ